MNTPAVIEYSNERVLTTQQLAEVYECGEERIRQSFSRNKERFIEGKHYYKLIGDALKKFKTEYLNDTQLKHVKELMLWTEKGADRHCKILDTNKAWEQFDNLEETYFQVKKKIIRPKKIESLGSVNNAVKILLPLLDEAGCEAEIKLLTARSIYEQAGIELPIDIKVNNQFLEAERIAAKIGVYSESGKPHGKAITAVIKNIPISKSDYTDTWESKEGWQGTVRKYSSSVYDAVCKWFRDNCYPPTVHTVNSKGKMMNYKVLYTNSLIQNGAKQ